MIEYIILAIGGTIGCYVGWFSYLFLGLDMHK